MYNTYKDQQSCLPKIIWSDITMSSPPPLPTVQVQVPGFGAHTYASESRETGNVVPYNNSCHLGSVIEVPPISVTSMFDAIGDHVPLKLKDEILEGHFVDLSFLIKAATDLEPELESGG